MGHIIINRKTRTRLLTALAVVTMTAGYAVTSYAEQTVATQIETALTAAGAGGKFASAVSAFYDARGHAPLWLTGRGKDGHAPEVLALFEESWTHGLNPESYNAGEIRRLLESADEDGRARLETLLTESAIRYARDLTGMRVDPAAVGQKARYWRQSLPADEILARLSADVDPVRALRAMAPDTPLYRALRKELARLSTEKNEYDRVLPLRFGGLLQPGDTHRDVEGLRIRLGKAVPASGATVYDDNLAAAVMSFQREHGLEPDGVIGSQTLAALNRSTQDQIEQVVANLERLRWLEQERPERYFLVNIPQQLLWAVEDGQVKHEMRVVVGMPSRKTKDFKAEVTGVRFNPRWTVPLNLKMQDFKPKLANNPAYLTEKGIRVTKNGNSVDPQEVDWANISRSEMSQMSFVQSAGDHNALGKIRVLMENDYDIYMHDTNHPEFFEAEQRTLSSGCVRLSEPEKVADFILEANAGWSDEKMENLIAAGKTVEVKADKSLPVFIVYQSMWLDAQGRLVYGADVYGRDDDLATALARMDGYALPGGDDSRFAQVSGLEESRPRNN